MKFRVFPLLFKDCKFVPLMFVTLGVGSPIPLLRASFHGLGTQTQGYKPKGYEGKLPELFLSRFEYQGHLVPYFSVLSLWDASLKTCKCCHIVEPST